MNATIETKDATTIAFEIGRKQGEFCSKKDRKSLLAAAGVDVGTNGIVEAFAAGQAAAVAEKKAAKVAPKPSEPTPASFAERSGEADPALGRWIHPTTGENRVYVNDSRLWRGCKLFFVGDSRDFANFKVSGAEGVQAYAEAEIIGIEIAEKYAASWSALSAAAK